MGLEVTTFFLDKSNGGITFKLIQNGMSGRGDLLNILLEVSTRKNSNAWVPQGSIVGPLLFLIHINVTEDFTTNAKLLTIYKVFVRSHLVYGGILYDQTCNMSFNQ